MSRNNFWLYGDPNTLGKVLSQLDLGIFCQNGVFGVISGLFSRDIGRLQIKALDKILQFSAVGTCGGREM
jgi:hypothetical protein